MEPTNKKVRFSPVEQQKQMFMNLHNIAMGYVPRPVQQDNPKVDYLELFRATCNYLKLRAPI